MDKNYLLHIDTVASNIIRQGLREDVVATALNLATVHESEFLTFVSRVDLKEADDCTKCLALHLYLKERFQCSVC